jgi:hypothetical protein
VFRGHGLSLKQRIALSVLRRVFADRGRAA